MSEAGGVLLGRAELERAFTALGERVAAGVWSPMYSSWAVLPWRWLTMSPA